MSTLTLQTFLGHGNVQQLQDFATVLLSRIEKEYSNTAEEINNVKSVFIDVYQAIKPGMKKMGRDYSGSVDPKITRGEDYFKSYSETDEEDFTLSPASIDVLSNAILQIRDHNWLDSEDENIKMLSEIMVLNITVTLMLEISKCFITSTLTSLNNINYYDCVLSKKHRILLYFIQTLPQNAISFLSEVKKVKLLSPSNGVVNIPSWVPDILRDTYSATFKYIKLTYSMIDKYIEEFFLSPTAFLMERQQNSKSLFVKFWNSTFQLPYYYSKYEIEKKRKNLLNLQKANISKLGYLLKNSPKYDLSNDLISTDFSNINGFLTSFIKMNVLTEKSAQFPSNDRDLNIDNLYFAFDTALPELKHRLSKIENDNSMPSYFTRNWPLIIPGCLFVGSYVPSTVRNIRLLIVDPQVRNELYLYVKELIRYGIDTTVSFWRHWVLNPITNILKTIRHDNNSEIALMSQQSLASDLESLERMAIDYIIDSHLNDGTADIEQIKMAIKSGDMTLIMNNYEKDLKNPIKSIVAGDMIRNILIQIQKTKVDGSLALNGVDQILKSQELVFGFVAASPSLFILWTLKNSFMGWYNGESRSSYKNIQTREIKTRVNTSLGQIEKLVDYMVSKKRDKNISDEVDYYKNGLVFIEVRNLKSLSKRLLPLYIYNQFKEDVEELVDANLDVEYKLLTVQRIWNVYGGYLR